MAQRTSGAGQQRSGRRPHANSRTLSADYTYYDDYAQSTPDEEYDYSTSRASSDLLSQPQFEYAAPMRRRTARVPKAAMRGRRKRRRASPLGVIFGMVALLVLAGAGAYAGYVYHASRAARQYAAPLLENATVASQFPHTSSINLMLIGRDYDYNDQDQVIKSNARSDMLMVARLDFARDQVQMLSIPRDTAANIPGYGVEKINAANELGGAALAEATVRQNFGVSCDHYVALNFDGFQKAIDRLGGVDCTVDKKMDYDDSWGHLHIHLLPGMQHLDGAQAMGFVRFRHSDSDIVRTQRQQALLAALKAKLVQPQTLELIPSLLDLLNDNVESDLTPGQKIALAKFMRGVPSGSLQMTTLPSIESQGQRLVATDRAAAAPLVQSMFGVQMPSSQLQLASDQTDGANRRRHHHRRRHRHDSGTDTDADTQGGAIPAVSISEVPRGGTGSSGANDAD